MFTEGIDMSEVATLITTVKALSELFISIHSLNLVQNSVYTIKSNQHIDSLIEGQPDIQAKLSTVMREITEDEGLDKIFEFIDLSTLEERMKDEPFISATFKGRDHGWCVAHFIRMDDAPTIHSVIFAVENINALVTSQMERNNQFIEENKRLKAKLNGE